MRTQVERSMLLLGAALCAIATCGAARADAEPEGSAAVLIAFESARESGDRLAKALDAQLAGSTAKLVVEWSPAPAPDLKSQLDLARSTASARRAVSTFWYIEMSGDEGFLYLTDATSARLLVRRLAWGPEEAREETIAVIVSSALDQLLRGGTIGMAEPALAPVPIPPPAPHRFTFGLEAAAAYQARSEPVPAMFGFDAGLALAPIGGLMIRAGFTLWNRATIEGELADIELRRIPYRIGASYAARKGPLGFSGGLSIVLDDARQRTVRIRTGDPLAVAHANRDLVVALAPEIALELSAAPRLTFVLSAGMEIPLNRVSYKYYSSNRNEVVETAWAVQPRASLGVRIWLF
jgi:hypothetical protein